MDITETTVLGLVAVSVALLLSLADWRKGLLACMAVGFLQDPLRKLWPGEPVYLTALVGIVFAAVVLGAAFRGELLAVKTTVGWRHLRWPVAVFCAVVVAQTGKTLAQYQNATLAALGVMGYLAPLAAAAVGYSFARSVPMIRRLLACYAMMSAAVATGIYLGFLGYDWPVLEQVGPGLILFLPDLQLDLFPGFMRSPDVAAWHAAAAVCVLVLLQGMVKRPWRKLATPALILFLLGATVLTGRRKAMAEIVLFLAAYWALLAYARAGARRMAAVAAVTALIAWLALPQLLAMEDVGPDLDPYLRHSATGFADAPDRFTSLGLGSVEWAINRHGLAGAGIGTGSQGGQHFGGGAALVGGAPEGGLGKIATELGLPGLLVVAWLMAALVHALWRGRDDAQRLPKESVALQCGLLAFLGANAVNFVLASQVYGDLFVLLLLGWSAGFVLAIPRLAASPPQPKRTKTIAQRADGRVVRRP